jgi:putative endonuclease
LGLHHGEPLPRRDVVGVTADLLRRVWQHRAGIGSIHAAEFGKPRLVYAERLDGIEPAIAREKLVKKWRREWKFTLIEADNPDWLDRWDRWHPPGEALKPDAEG